MAGEKSPRPHPKPVPPAVNSTPPAQPPAPAAGGSAVPGPAASPAPNVNKASPTPPAPLPGDKPPALPESPVATCCPDVSTFEGSKIRANYFGFDPKTNLVANAGTDEYWLPPAKAKTLPSNRTTRDGARWVSVGVGKETEVEISFAGQTGNGCIANCTYEIAPASIADVVTKAVNASGVVFKIKGKAQGEASLKVVCQGKTIGWFHIWCKQPARIRLDIGTLLTANSRAATYSAADMEAVMNRIYSQALVEIIVRDVGTIDITANATVTKLEEPFFKATSFAPDPALLTAAHLAARAVLEADAKKAKKPFAHAPYQLFYYVPAAIGPAWGGEVLQIGKSPGFVYFDGGANSYNSMAHELGHSFGLRHPSDSSVTGQLPAHLVTSKGSATLAQAATNTEPAVPANGAHANIMALDPLNLMGYWSPKAPREPLRYGQWKSCARS